MGKQLGLAGLSRVGSSGLRGVSSCLVPGSGWLGQGGCWGVCWVGRGLRPGLGGSGLQMGSSSGRAFADSRDWLVPGAPLPEPVRLPQEVQASRTAENSQRDGHRASSCTADRLGRLERTGSLESQVCLRCRESGREPGPASWVQTRPGRRGAGRGRRVGDAQGTARERAPRDGGSPGGCGSQSTEGSSAGLGSGLHQ